jgi:hypothetical protein
MEISIYSTFPRGVILLKEQYYAYMALILMREFSIISVLNFLKMVLMSIPWIFWAMEILMV